MSQRHDYWILALSLFLTFVLIIRGTPGIRVHYDDFYFANLALDIFKNSGSLADWHLIAAPRFFPEMLIFFAAVPMLGDLFRVTFFVSFLLIALQFGLVFALIRHVTSRHYLAVSAAVTFISLNAWLGEEVTSYGRPGWHMGAFINLLLSLWLLMHRAESAPARAGLFIVCLLGVISDFLFLALMIPATACWVLIRCWLERKVFSRHALLSTATVILGCISGVICYYILVSHPVENPVHASGISPWGIVKDPFALASVVFLVLRDMLTSGLSLASFILVCVVMLSAKLTAVEKRAYLQIAAFLIGGAVANEVILSIGTLNIDRYRILSINGVTVLISISIAFALSRFTKLRLLLFFFPVLVLGAQGSRTNDYPFSQQFQSRMDQVNCFVRYAEGYGIENGAADYRLSQAEPLYSNNRLKILPLKGSKTRISPQFISDRWLSRTYHFVLAQKEIDPGNRKRRKMLYKLAVADVLPILGEPDEVHQCGSDMMLIYKSGLVVERGRLVRKDDNNPTLEIP